MYKSTLLILTNKICQQMHFIFDSQLLIMTDVRITTDIYLIF